MTKRSILFVSLALAMTCRSGITQADESATADHRVAPGIHEVADQELAGMRGRYVVGDNTVLWFGVEMVSTWQTANGQALQSALTLGLNFSKNPNQPQVTFVPTVTIATLSQAIAAPGSASNLSRSVQSGGLANVSGLTQSVQIAGDDNATSNVTSLNIQSTGGIPTSPVSNSSTPSGTSADATPSGTNVAISSPMVTANSSAVSVPSGGAASAPAGADTANTQPVVNTIGTDGPGGRYASSGNATASATYSGNSAQVNLAISGQGAVSQWIRSGSIGQTIALTADNQIVTNQMIVSMVTQSIGSATSQLAHNLAQSLNLNHATR